MKIYFNPFSTGTSNDMARQLGFGTSNAISHIVNITNKLKGYNHFYTNQHKCIYVLVK